MTLPRVLIVDDNVDLAENLREIFEDEGYECIVTDNGDAALKELDQQPVDVVLTDLKMEGMSGLDVLKEVSARWPRTPVLIITAYARECTVDTARAEGAAEILAKPLDIRALLQRVRSLIEHRGRVLIVEDEADLRDNLVEILRRWQALDLVAVGTFKEASRALQSQSFDVAFIDLRLPDGSGLELARALSRHGTKVVFTTAYPDDLLAAFFVSESAAMPKILRKPFPPDALMSFVRRAV